MFILYDLNISVTTSYSRSQKANKLHNFYDMGPTIKNTILKYIIWINKCIMQKYTDMTLLNCFGLHCAQYKGIKTNIPYHLTITPELECQLQRVEGYNWTIGTVEYDK